MRYLSWNQTRNSPAWPMKETSLFEFTESHKTSSTHVETGITYRCTKAEPFVCSRVYYHVCIQSPPQIVQGLVSRVAAWSSNLALNHGNIGQALGRKYSLPRNVQRSLRASIFAKLEQGRTGITVTNLFVRGYNDIYNRNDIVFADLSYFYSVTYSNTSFLHLFLLQILS